MFYWKKLRRFVDMKHSIDFLPQFAQDDLCELVTLIREEVEDAVMIILFGSYAKNTFVYRDVTVDYGGGLIEFNSDYDILVVSKKRLGKSEGCIETRIRDRFAEGKNEDEVTKVQIISESISKLNNALSEGRYFYVDIVNEGVMLYDSGEYTLDTPRELNYSEIKEMATEYYEIKKHKADRHYRYFQIDYEDEHYADSAFNLHQITEHLIKSIALVYVLYGHKEHDLKLLLKKIKCHTRELHKIFPRNTVREKHLFDLLRRAYIEARYNPKFVVTKEEADALAAKVERLKQVVEEVCRDRFAYYDSRIGK